MRKLYFSFALQEYYLWKIEKKVITYGLGLKFIISKFKAINFVFDF